MCDARVLMLYIVQPTSGQLAAYGLWGMKCSARKKSKKKRLLIGVSDPGVTLNGGEQFPTIKRHTVHATGTPPENQLCTMQLNIAHGKMRKL